ncbi:uncharacterized protein METZ01_LOCUS95955 [marine metagenome]|uniref:Uncharacterized protein n=1 Tax=marine metagenome TaxID=408172 RepID=A0A381VSP8_9ZZZZ
MRVPNPNPAIVAAGGQPVVGRMVR